MQSREIRPTRLLTTQMCDYKNPSVVAGPIRRTKCSTALSRWLLLSLLWGWYPRMAIMLQSCRLSSRARPQTCGWSSSGLLLVEPLDSR